MLALRFFSYARRTCVSPCRTFLRRGRLGYDTNLYLPLFTVAVCGLHMRGLALNHQLTDLGAKFVRSAYTAPLYRLYALAGKVQLDNFAQAAPISRHAACEPCAGGETRAGAGKQQREQDSPRGVCSAASPTWGVPAEGTAPAGHRDTRTERWQQTLLLSRFPVRELHHNLARCHRHYSNRGLGCLHCRQDLRHAADFPPQSSTKSSAGGVAAVKA